MLLATPKTKAKKEREKHINTIHNAILAFASGSCKSINTPYKFVKDLSGRSAINRNENTKPWGRCRTHTHTQTHTVSRLEDTDMTTCNPFGFGFRFQFSLSISISLSLSLSARFRFSLGLGFCGQSVICVSVISYFLTLWKLVHLTS